MTIQILFSTMVQHEQYDMHKEFKEIFFNNDPMIWFNDGMTNETIANNLHHDLVLSSIYRFITCSIKTYLKNLFIDDEQFDIYIHKSWLNVNKNAGNPIHTHEDSHISFVYHLNTPIEAYLRFYNLNNMNDPYKGFLADHSKSWNEFNSRTWDFVSEEGILNVFPSTIPHDVHMLGQYEKEKDCVSGIDDLRNNWRISLAGDALLLSKEPQKKYRVLQPFDFWRKFDV